MEIRVSMKLDQLPKTTTKPKRRLGRGYGSGRGKTAGRGTKGQKARGKVKLGFEGGQLPLIRRLPLRRGKGRNKPLGKKPIVINIKYLDLLPQNSIVNKESLVDFGLVKKEEVEKYGVKILGDGELKKPLVVKLPCSGGARKKIEKAGGKVEGAEKTKKKG